MRIPTAVAALLATVSVAACSCGRPTGVPIVRETHGPAPELIRKAGQLREAGRLLSMEKVEEQLGEATCRLSLPAARRVPLTGSELWDLARRSHIRVGYLFLCNKCRHWHLNIAGGYAITAGGAVATCYHVVEPKEMREGYLVATTEGGEVLPVTAILAANKFTDACIIQVESSQPLVPLPLNTKIRPGDDIWCYSDPGDRCGYFTTGIVNRFYQHWHGASSREKFPVRMNVSADWAPGSSGAAVLDRFGNAVGHVTTVSVHGEKAASQPATAPSRGPERVIVFHDAVCAADVLALIER